MHFVGRLCEEFGCTPSVAYREWCRQPEGVLEELIEARAIARLYGLVERATTAAAIGALPKSPLMDAIRLVDMEIDSSDE